MPFLHPFCKSAQSAESSISSATRNCPGRQCIELEPEHLSGLLHPADTNVPCLRLFPRLRRRHRNIPRPGSGNILSGHSWSSELAPDPLPIDTAEKSTVFL